MDKKSFKSIHIDLEKGIYEINGQSIKGESITELHLYFENGKWELRKKYTLIGFKKLDERR